MVAKEVFLGRNEDFAYVLGVYLGDASITSDKIQLNSVDLDFVEHFKTRAMKWTGCTCSPVTMRPSCLQKYPNGKTYKRRAIYRTYLLSTVLVKHLELLDYGEIDKMSKDEEKAFIEGFFDSEGHVIYNRTKKQLYVRIAFTNTDNQLLEKIRCILNKFGIYPATKLGVFRNVSGRSCYILHISSREGCKKFARTFKCSIKRKQSIIEKFINIDTSITNPSAGLKKYWSEKKRRGGDICPICGKRSFLLGNHIKIHNRYIGAEAGR